MSAAPVTLYIHADDNHGTRFDSLYEAQQADPEDPESRIIALDETRTVLAVAAPDHVGWVYTQAGTRRVFAELTGGVKCAAAADFSKLLEKAS